MKKILFLFIALILITSCASFPAKNNNAVLVIGSIELDYPDGFFDQRQPKNIVSRIALKVRNIDTNKEFYVFSDKEGYYKFLANPGENFIIVNYEYTLESGRTHYRTAEYLKMQFNVIEEKINYICHAKYVYGKGKAVEKQGSSTNYDFEVRLLISDKQSDLTDYLNEKKNGNIWLEDGIVIPPSIKPNA